MKETQFVYHDKLRFFALQRNPKKYGVGGFEPLIPRNYDLFEKTQMFMSDNLVRAVEKK